ncbi:DUF1127 domain-containing protein [Loktanella sp. S4079]|uniref:DUF1127 domain-containing protein n=1 Tax=Loktanella sp. S4079 TaxID=579483 RepID=UPI0005FA77DC|nr:DUF1127 domain-containing protein [Loktanella sp. S4079]KJZ18281.1 hypothetical protein TW80_15225 [Loktanella sp. S4079]
MANVNTNLAASSILAGRVTSFCHLALNAVAQWNDARITRNALLKLSARELDDIGLTFADIEKVAARKAY